MDGRSLVIPFGLGVPGLILTVRGVGGSVGAAVFIHRELTVRIGVCTQTTEKCAADHRSALVYP